MTVSVFNNLGGQKIGDSGYVDGGVAYGFLPQRFSGSDARKRARFQFDFKRPTHCLLEADVADILGRNEANCTVFPISLDEDITTVCPRILHIHLAQLIIINVCIFNVSTVCMCVCMYVSAALPRAVRLSGSFAGFKRRLKTPVLKTMLLTTINSDFVSSFILA